MTMNLLRRNIIANFVGQGWSALIGLAFVPLYIRFLGIEAYGLIGVFAMLLGAFQILDFGLSPTMSREMARYSASPERTGEVRDFVRTLESVYWAIGIVIGIAVLIISPFIAGHWIKPRSIPVETVQHAVAIMGLLSILQWPLSFYEGGLRGLQKQVLSNSIKIGIATLGSFGAVFMLWKFSPTVTVFFTWQIFVSALSVTLFTFSLWHSLPPSGLTLSFKPNLLRNIWRFAAGMSGISVSAIILTQLDKVILSKILSLEMFGYYVLAGVVSSGISSAVAGPLFYALLPRFTALSTLRDEAALTLLYHQGSQLMAVLVLPIAAVLAFFSFDILLLWTGSLRAAEIASPILSVLIVGTALNALMCLPYALQLSHGWTSLGFGIAVLLIITMIPAIIFMTVRFGALGASSVWVSLNAIYMFIGVPLTHRRLLKGEMGRWFFQDIIPPLGVAFLMAGFSRWLIVGQLSRVTSIMSLSVVLLGVILAAALVASHVRGWLLTLLSQRFGQGQHS